MAQVDLPAHVVSVRRDGRREVLLHRSMAVVGEEKVEIRAARGLVVLPLIGLVVAAAVAYWIVTQDGTAPFWALVLGLLFCLLAVPVAVMSLVSSFIGADVVVDAKKGSATWQQGYLGMGIGTKELVPFAKIDHLAITVEGEEADRWRGEQDDLRQFALWLVKKSGKRLRLAQVPVPAYGQADGMDRTLAVAQAVAALTGAEVRLPGGWELVEIDTETGEVVERAREMEPPPPPPAAAGAPGPANAGLRTRGKRGGRRR